MNSVVRVEIISKGLTPSFKQAIKKACLMTVENLPSKVKLRYLKMPFEYEIALSIVTPLKSAELNGKYRKKNYPTDVLSFSRIENPILPSPDIGDIVICLTVAKKQAKEYGVSLKNELERLTVHGTLHLFGYDHEINQKEERRMFRLQEKILAKL